MPLLTRTHLLTTCRRRTGQCKLAAPPLRSAAQEATAVADRAAAAAAACCAHAPPPPTTVARSSVWAACVERASRRLRHTGRPRGGRAAASHVWHARTDLGRARSELQDGQSGSQAASSWLGPTRQGPTATLKWAEAPGPHTTGSLMWVPARAPKVIYRPSYEKKLRDISRFHLRL